MFFQEMKRKYCNLIFLFIIIAGGYWLYASIKPSADTRSYDVYKYAYYKPLSKEEFIYFNLTKDYKEGNTVAYSNTEDEKFWPEYTVRLNAVMKKYFLDVIKKMNPDYQLTEKMNDVVLQLDDEEVKPYLEDLEKKLNVPSFYYTGMYAPEAYNKKYDMVASPSPYWIYLESGKRIFSKEEYFQCRKDFELSFREGISKGYTFVALDSIGIFIGLLSVVCSFQAFSEDKRANSNGFIYTEKIHSLQHVLGKYFATVIPLLLVSFFYMLFAAGCFLYWNNTFAYGYSISISTFLEQVPLVLFPTVCIIVSVSLLLGILIQNEIITAILQFVFFYLSISRVPNHKFSLHMIIRYNDFDDYSFYRTYLKYVPANRFFMVLSAAVCICLTTLLFAYRKGHGELFSWGQIRKRRKFSFASQARHLDRIKILKRGSGKAAAAKGLLPYLARQSLHRGIFLYIPYLCLLYPIVITKNMDASAIAAIGENILIFASLFLFIPLGNMEKANGMEGQVFTAVVSYPLVYMVRVCIAGCILFALVELPLGVLCIGSAVPPGRWWIGVYLSSLFIGLLSLFVTEVMENSFLGYFVYILYYFLDAVLKHGMLLPLSGYTKGIGHTKMYLAAAAVFIFFGLAACAALKIKGIRLVGRYGNKD